MTNRLPNSVPPTFLLLLLLLLLPLPDESGNEIGIITSGINNDLLCQNVDR